MAKAKELLMTGDIAAAEAERIGLINKVVPHDQLLYTAMELARRLATGPTLAVRGTKHMLNKKVWNDLNQAMDLGSGAGREELPPCGPQGSGPGLP